MYSSLLFRPNDRCNVHHIININKVQIDFIIEHYSTIPVYSARVCVCVCVDALASGINYNNNKQRNIVNEVFLFYFIEQVTWGLPSRPTVPGPRASARTFIKEKAPDMRPKPRPTKLKIWIMVVEAWQGTLNSMPDFRVLEWEMWLVVWNPIGNIWGKKGREIGDFLQGILALRSRLQITICKVDFFH